MTVAYYGDMMALIIPYQELLGNYDVSLIVGSNGLYYTIPRAIREL